MRDYLILKGTIGSILRWGSRSGRECFGELVGMGSAPFGPGRDDDGLTEAKQFTSGDQRQDSNKRMQTQHMAHDARADDLPFEDVNDDEVPQDQRGDDQSPGGKGNHDIGDSGGNGADMGINSR